MRPAPARRPQHGVSLIEATISLAVTAILLGTALPGFDAARQRRHLEGAAAVFETDVQLARSSAVSLGRTVRIDFENAPGATCYVIHTGAAGDCSCLDTAPVCRAGQALRQVRYGGGEPFRLTSNSRSIVFDDVAGTVTPTATVRFVAASGEAVHQVVNVMGRVRSCSPSALPGYKPC